MLLGRGYGRVATDTTLPYRISHLGLAVWLSGNGKVGEEEEVDQGINEFFSQGFRLFEFRHGRFDLGVVGLGLIEQDLGLNGGSSGPFPPRAPKELLLPCLQMLGLVEIWYDAVENAYAVERILFRRKFGVGKRRVMPKNKQSRGDGQYQRF
jgi:hypothetical protein